ncbi:chemotaxis protein CheB [Funiculus sociatus GB2-A5]|uniref:protein-glutamate methylesterase n=1 Tax=Funiculus sociatus GB2-A5 TaxID=2933946 RepID=A0ABV0JLA7_9CYAN|nr:chemotaxis protein CheB [Trichocoleus sp. FACHB-6]MBD2065508.1 chemotaxis protein CheB [Trichocoleus sp. FACHB-6]
MPGHDIIVIGASAGGVEALSKLVKALPTDLPAAIFVVLHVPAHGTSLMPNILNRYGTLRAAHPEDGAPIQHGHIYVAPPNYHLMIKRGYVHLARGPKENGHRPAVDPLFRTAAQHYGRRVIGVVLSGNLDDGTAGLAGVKSRGGIAIAQNPDEALFSGMPRSAIENVDVDHILPLNAIAPFLVRLAQEQVEEKAGSASAQMETETDLVELDMAAHSKYERPGTPSGFACPDCGGALWELGDGKLLRFRCRTGHAFSGETLLAEQSEALETALWSGLRALEERAALANRMFKGAHERNQARSAQRFAQQEQEAQQNAAVIRQVLLKGLKHGDGEEVENGQNGRVDNRNWRDGAETLSSQPPVPSPESPFPIVAIASSAGGMKALTELLSALPENFPAAIAIVQHLEPHRASQLAEILNARMALPVKQAQQGDQLRPGKVYIAPPNHHLLVNPDATIELSKTELVHFVRPSADLLFESVAASFKERAIAVILTGKGSDGASGIQAIKKMGGKAIAQDQTSSDSFGMPGNAIDTGCIDWILPLDEIATTLLNLMMDSRYS